MTPRGFFGSIRIIQTRISCKTNKMNIFIDRMYINRLFCRVVARVALPIAGGTLHVSDVTGVKLFFTRRRAAVVGGVYVIGVGELGFIRADMRDDDIFS